MFHSFTWFLSLFFNFCSHFYFQSVTTMDMVSKDLSEFYQTIQVDTANTVADTASRVQEKLRVCICLTYYLIIILQLLETNCQSFLFR